MGFGPAPPPPRPLPPHKRPFKVKDVKLHMRRRDGSVSFEPVSRTFILAWKSWLGTPRQKVLATDELPKYLTDEEIARCLAAAIAASATP